MYDALGIICGTYKENQVNPTHKCETLVQTLYKIPSNVYLVIALNGQSYY